MSQLKQWTLNGQAPLSSWLTHDRYWIDPWRHMGSAFAATVAAATTISMYQLTTVRTTGARAVAYSYGVQYR